MKKIVLALLLLYLATAGNTCSCDAACTSTTAATCGCGCASPTQGSFNVNQQVVIDTPQNIAPACPVPNIPVPVVSPPSYAIPKISVDQVQVCNLQAPSVVAPPTVIPPSPLLPNINLPAIPVPQLPAGIPNPSTPIAKPTAPVILPPLQPVGSACTSLSKIFTLSFEWACRRTISFTSCQGNILWNNAIIASIVPSDYSIHIFKVNVSAVVGQNSLQIEGAGISDSYGLTIDNVQLVRVGSAQNIVVNGDFQTPYQAGGWHIFNSIPGWQGLGIEIGWGDIYNIDWNSQVLELDGNSNFEVTQYFNFDSNFQITGNTPNNVYGRSQTLNYVLEFDYSARKNGASSPLTSQAEILWNDEVIASLVPQDFNVYHFNISVKVKAGANTLAFDSAGVSDGYGLIIDNVRLASIYNSNNLISNGNFGSISAAPGYWNYYNNGITGWWAVKAEVGHCRTVYNDNWPAAAGNCIELDTDSNQRYIQIITISQQNFNSLFISIQNQQGISNVQNNLNSAACAARDRLSSAVARISDDMLCQVRYINKEYCQYIDRLYSCSNESIKDLRDDEEVVLNQYDYLLDAYTNQYGCSHEDDFADDYFAGIDLFNWSGHIQSIGGKVITCHDDQGHTHSIQISPCTHFEGQFPLPRIGDRVYWKGVPDKCGRTYVKVITTCNC